MMNLNSLLPEPCRFSALLGVVASCSLAIPAVAQNLLQDPGLEASTGGTQENPSWTLEVNTPNGASAVFQDAPWASNPAGQAGIGLWLKAFEGGPGTPAAAELSQTVAGQEDFTYELSAWHRVETNYTSEKTLLGIDFFQGATLLRTVEIDLNPLSTADGGWRRYSVSGNSPDGTDTVRVRAQMVGGVNANASPQSAMFDDFSLNGAEKVTVPVDALVGFYSFDDEAAPLNDDSGNMKHLFSAGAIPDADPVYQPAGGFRGGAYEFNGQQRLVSPVDINPDVIPNLTMGAWVRTNSLSPGLRQVIGSDDGGWDRTIGLDNREGEFRYTGFIGNGRPVVGTPGPLSTEDWTFLAAVSVHDVDTGEGTITVYVDLNANTTGDALVAVSEPTLFGPGNFETSVGSLRPDVVNEGWDGAIDNVFFYDVALTVEQLTLVRNAGTPAPSEGDDPDLIVTSEPTLTDLPKDPVVSDFTYQIRNGGLTRNLEISAVDLSGADAAVGHYSVKEFPASLGPGESGSVVLTFDNKGQVGAFTGLMEIVSNDESQPGIIRDASATVVPVDPPDPVLTVVTDPAFGELAPGSGVTTRTIEIRNTGALETLSLVSLATAGTDAAKYTVDSFTDTVAPGATGTIRVTLDPGGAIGTFFAQLEIVSTSGSGRFTVIDLNARIPPEDIRSALLGFYPFDVADPRADQSGNGKDLVEGASPEPFHEAAGGIEGGAYEFDGVSHIVAPIDINPAVQPELTMGAFVRASIDAVELPGLYKILGSDNGGWDRTIGLDDREGGFRYTSFIGNGRPVVGTPEVVSEEDWTFIAATYSEATDEVTVYVDLDVSTTDDALVAVAEPTSFNPGFDTVSIGSLSPANTSEAWRGFIDNVFFYGIELTAEELTRIRDGGRDAIIGPGPDPMIWFTAVRINAAGGVVLAWDERNAPGPYLVEFSDNLDGAWQELADSIAGMTFTDNLPQGIAVRYYRVSQE